MKRTIAFLTATRADYGKLKSVLRRLHDDPQFDVHIFVTGMHMLERFGGTAAEVLEDGYGDIVCDEDYHYEPRMDVAISNVIQTFSRFVRKVRPGIIAVHGDRLDAIAGAIVGAFNNILVAHIEGGEISGTIDESIRHAVSKFSHLHFVANQEAKTRLIQMGESKDNIFVVGSPDIDMMLSPELPSFEEVLLRYDIPFREYGILLYHPVVTEVKDLENHVHEVITALKDSKKNYVAIYPNNDPGNEIIRRAYEKLPNNFHVYPSMRFEYFLTLLKNAEFIVGNSSAGIREACVYGIPAIDIGTRQSARYSIKILKNIIHTYYRKDDILDAIARAPNFRHISMNFGAGESAGGIHSVLSRSAIWATPKQKQFRDLSDWPI